MTVHKFQHRVKFQSAINKIKMKIFQYFIVPILANFEDYKACLDFYGEELRKCGENVSEYPICLEEDPNYRPLGSDGSFGPIYY